MHHCWTVACRVSSIDRDSHNVTLADTLEQLNLPGEVIDKLDKELAENSKAGLHFPHQVFCWFVRSNPEKPERGGQARLKFLAPDGKQLSPATPIPVRLKEEGSYRARVLNQGVLYKGLGRYWYVTEIKKRGKWVESSRIPLRILRQPEEVAS